MESMVKIQYGEARVCSEITFESTARLSDEEIGKPDKQDV